MLATDFNDSVQSVRMILAKKNVCLRDSRPCSKLHQPADKRECTFSLISFLSVDSIYVFMHLLNLFSDYLIDIYYQLRFAFRHLFMYIF